MVYFTKFRLLSHLIRLSNQVKSALDAGQPVVALESTVITHGLPFPQNLEVGRALERTVLNEGGIPATIALLNGQIHVGLTERELEQIADPIFKAVKVSSRDIPNVLATSNVGGTTVAATMKIAAMVGIKVFATGGIGGVHRGAEKTFDISADLIELGKTPVAVVCAGAKSILDIPKTLEFLETFGTNVIVYNNDPMFPGFFTRKTKHKAPFHSDSLDKIAKILKINSDLGLKNGTLIACPISEEFDQESDRIEQAIQKALIEAEEQLIVGKEMTPFLLKRVNELTNNVSMKLNIALLKNNAKIATQLAKKLCRNKTSTVYSKQKSIETKKQPNVLCVGGSIFDLEIFSEIDPKNDGGSIPSKFVQRAGGVARNHAEAFHRLGCKAPLISVAGNDLPGKFLFNEKSNLNIDHVFMLDDVKTSIYVAINVNGNIQHGFSAIEESSKALTPARVESKAHLFEEADYVFLEGNLQPETLNRCIELSGVFDKKIWYDPTDIHKVYKITDHINNLTAFSPNLNEFVEYCKNLGVFIPNNSVANLETLADFMNANHSFLHRVFPEQMEILLITMGPSGCLLLSRSKKVQITTIPAPSYQTLISASGTGDCFNAAFLTSLLNGANLDGCMQSGQKAASLSLQSSETVPDTITYDSVIKPYL